MFFKVFHGSLAFHPWRFLAALTRGAAAMLLVLTGLLGIVHPTSAADGKFVNLSTRALVATGDEVMIGGFIIEDGARQMLIQAVGPELANAGISNALADPVLTVTITTDPGNPFAAQMARVMAKPRHTPSARGSRYVLVSMKLFTRKLQGRVNG